MRPLSRPEDFWARVSRQESGCWLWLGYRMQNGYGSLTWHRGRILAHRLAYQLVHGPIPPGLCVCHTCAVRHCVNPEHLWLGTVAENQIDMQQKGRAVSGSKLHPERMPRGEQHQNARLTAAQVEAIRDRYVPGTGNRIRGTAAELAAEYGISPRYLRKIATGQRWRM